MKIKFLLLLLIVVLSYVRTNAQLSDKTVDSLYISSVQDVEEPGKVLHAEPLYIDLIRDLGARKGESEWNVAFGIIDNYQFDEYEALVEYEWAPMDRLGLEIELPFTFYTPNSQQFNRELPSSKINSLKLATQWSFFVDEDIATSLAIGYINEFELSEFNNFGEPLIIGNVYNPFLVAAKRWGNNFHSLLYTGPRFIQEFALDNLRVEYDINTSFHYMITGTRNFIGIEFNKTLGFEDFDMTIRPQMRLGISDNIMVGIVGGIPINREDERLSSFLRLIWEPGAH